MYSGIEFYLGEVVETSNTHQIITSTPEENNLDYLYTIRVLLYSDKTLESDPVAAKPYNLHACTIPAKGEHVLLFKGYSPIGTSNEQWYYFPVIGMNSNIENNFLPGLVDKSNTPDDNISTKPISSAQMYPGDHMLQGRWGNTIRLGSTVKSNSNSVTPTWTGNTNNPDPIIILSNTKNNRSGKQFVVENIDSDYSSLWLTSTQNISNFTTNNPLRKSKTNGSSLIGSADKIILKSKDDVVALDSNKAIELNAPVISMGTNQDKEPVLHSTAIIEIIGELIKILSAGTKKGDRLLLRPQLVPLLWKLYTQAENTNILQDKYKGNKNVTFDTFLDTFFIA
jgi:hypothetical protein